MAHQAHNIPWRALTSNLEWKSPTLWNNFATNLYPRMKPAQANDLTYFVNQFVTNLEEHAICERRKYREQYDIPNPSDVILDENIVRKIIPTVRRWRESWYTSIICPSDTYTSDHRYFQTHSCTDKCEPIPSEERKMSAFLRSFRSENCRDFENNNAVFFNMEMVKTLLLYGEMDALLRVCAHPETHLKESFERGTCWECGPYFNRIGWDQIGRLMLRVYICLNVAYCFPELWDPTCGRTTTNDYRNSIFYQRTLIECARPIGEYSNVGKYPHSRFFGLDSCKAVLKMDKGRSEHWLLNENRHLSYIRVENQSTTWRWYLSHRNDGHAGFYGRVPIEEFLSLWLPGYPAHEPSYSDTIWVRMIICSKGLPIELALDIMELADYNPINGQLDPPYDPLHPLNREQLDKHLKYCWQTMVRCFMITKVLGLDPVNGGEREPGMNWTGAVAECIVELFGVIKKIMAIRSQMRTNGLIGYGIQANPTMRKAFRVMFFFD